MLTQPATRQTVGVARHRSRGNEIARLVVLVALIGYLAVRAVVDLDRVAIVLALIAVFFTGAAIDAAYTRIRSSK